MNAVTGFVAIVSLLLALGVGSGTVKEPTGVSPNPTRQVTPSKLATNHNETLVRDMPPVK